MAKKSLKKRIDDLIDALGRAQKPTFTEIRNELAVLGPLVESLENGQALAEKDARIAALETELGNLNVLLQKANTELDSFRAEWKKQEQEGKRAEIPEIQFQILKRMPSEHGGDRPDVNLIAHAFNIEVDEAEIHLDALEKAGLATWGENTYGVVDWHRTMEGNKLVLAKRLASSGEKTKKTYKHAELPQIQHEILLTLAGIEGGMFETEIAQSTGKSLALIQFTLRILDEAKMVIGEKVTYGVDCKWYLMRKGEEYLAERDLL